MSDIAKIQKQLDEIKSKIETLELEEKNVDAGQKPEIINQKQKLRDEQLRLTQQIEQQTGLSGVLGDVKSG